MIENLLNGLFNGLISVIEYIANLFIGPIDSLVNQYLPNLAGIFNSIGSFLSNCMTYVGWLIDALMIPVSILEFLGIYYTFKLTIPLIVSGIKWIIKWFETFKFGG